MTPHLSLRFAPDEAPPGVLERELGRQSERFSPAERPLEVELDLRAPLLAPVEPVEPVELARR